MYLTFSQYMHVLVISMPAPVPTVYLQRELTVLAHAKLSNNAWHHREQASYAMVMSTGSQTQKKRFRPLYVESVPPYEGVVPTRLPHKNIRKQLAVWGGVLGFGVGTHIRATITATVCLTLSGHRSQAGYAILINLATKQIYILWIALGRICSFPFIPIGELRSG